MSNAIKFRGHKSPEIKIEVQDNSQEWEFSIADNGIGMDPKDFERVFIVFQRLNKRDEYDGTGIGLAICKKIVKRHGGRIWVESEKGKGSIFYFTISKEFQNMEVAYQ